MTETKENLLMQNPKYKDSLGFPTKIGEFIQPEYSEWACRLFGEVVYRPKKGYTPTLIQRWMCKYLIGCTWFRYEEKK